MPDAVDANGPPAPLRDPRDRPNVVLVNCDDLGYGDVGCYGSTVHRTPRLDRMAAEGTRFTDFYMAASVCSPSRAAMMTGCYPRRVGLDFGDSFAVLLPGDSIGLSSDEIIIPEILKTAGYATHMIGKWHIGDQPEFLPTRHGFDSYFGLPYSNDMLPDHPGNDRFNFPELPLMRQEEVVETDPNQASLTERYLRDAVRFIREHRAEPFFLYFAHMYVHVPLYAPMKYLCASQNGPYGACVEHIDHCMGVLLDTLAKLGIDGNTLVIFTSDNGAASRGAERPERRESLPSANSRRPPQPPGAAGAAVGGGRYGSNAPLRGSKGTTWEGGMRLPMIARWPGVIPEGQTCGEIATSMDFLPTFAHLAGAADMIPAERIIDGQDIRPLLLGDDGAETPHEAFFYYGVSRSLDAVRSGRWKLHVQSGELYDLEADIGETTNVAGVNPDVVARLQSLAAACREDLGDDATGAAGKNCRPPGKVESPVTLLPRPDDPAVRAAYD